LELRARPRPVKRSTLSACKIARLPLQPRHDVRLGLEPDPEARSVGLLPLLLRAGGASTRWTPAPLVAARCNGRHVFEEGAHVVRGAQLPECQRPNTPDIPQRAQQPQ